MTSWGGDSSWIPFYPCGSRGVTLNSCVFFVSVLGSSFGLLSQLNVWDRTRSCWSADWRSGGKPLDVLIGHSSSNRVYYRLYISASEDAISLFVLSTCSSALFARAQSRTHPLRTSRLSTSTSSRGNIMRCLSSSYHFQHEL